MERLETLLVPSLEKRAEAPVYWWKGEWIKGAALLESIQQNRETLLKAGFCEGQRLMVLLPNCPALLTLAIAVWSLRGTLIPLNVRAGTGNLLPTIDLIQPFAVVTARGDDKAAAGVLRFPVVSVDPEGTLDKFRGIVKRPTSSEDAVFFTTSGTTGLPKAVPLTHENLIENVRAMRKAVAFRIDDTYLWVLPNFHSFGFTLGLLLPQMIGGKCTLVPNFMPPLETLKAIAESKATVLFLVPAMLEFLKRSAAHNPIRPDSVRMVITGGDRLNVELDKASVEVFGMPILEGYGATECSPVVSVNVDYEHRKLGTIGPVLPGYEWKVCDESGEALPPETPGVLFLKGKSVFKGYFEAPEVTAERLSPDGWYNSGDVVKYDKDGYITVLDRVTDIIIVGGFNVYPQEVERILNVHPAVASAAVVSLHHSVNGEIPRAFIVLKENKQVTDRDIIEYCKGKLANYKIPRKVDFVDSLPLSPSGKILRRKLRELA